MKISTRHYRERQIKGGDCLIIVAGNIACGKTTLCDRLRKDLHIQYVEVNNIKNVEGNIIFEFFDYCEQDIQDLKSNIVYDYRSDDYNTILNKCINFINIS